MYKIWLPALCALILLIPACSDPASPYSSMKVSAEQSASTIGASGKAGIYPPDKANQASEGDLADTNKKLADKLNTIAKDNFNEHNEMAALEARLYLTPDIQEVYDILPAPVIENGWYDINQIITLKLKGYDKATRVRFLATMADQHLIPAVLGVDEDSADGWSYHGPLIGEGETVVWAEVTSDDGQVTQTPVIPVQSSLEEDATAYKPATLFQNISKPDEVVEQYYKLTHAGDYNSAWDLIHPSERDHPASSARNAFRQQFLALQGTKGAALEQIVSSKMLDTYKIYVTQITTPNVLEMQLKLVGGEEKTIHLLEDSQKRWRLFWESDRGLE